MSIVILLRQTAQQRKLSRLTAASDVDEGEKESRDIKSDSGDDPNHYLTEGESR